jgi:hypothetical protein
VVFYERDLPYYASARDMTQLADGSELRLYAEWSEVAREARREADESDAAIVTSYCPDALAASRILLSYAGGRTLDALRDRLGARRVPLYGSADPALHQPAPTMQHLTERRRYGPHA